MTARLLLGDALAVLQAQPTRSVDFIATSPPFLGQRSYLADDDELKPLEQGAESTSGEFVDNLLDVIEECSRVLADHGSICIELGDKYAKADGPDGPLHKSLKLVPETLRFALTYGFNPLTRRETPRWRTRNVVRWVKPNPTVGRLGDKFRPASNDMVIICKSVDRYFDLEAVRGSAPVETFTEGRAGRLPPSGAPPLDWWLVKTSAYRGEHDAVWPAELLINPIKAMTPHRVCAECNEPSRRIVHAQRTIDGYARDDSTPIGGKFKGGGNADGIGNRRKGTTYTTTGWTDCGHNAWRNGRVLDPYAGSGTTLEVAQANGFDGLGIDLNRRNAEEVRRRLGMFVEIEDFTAIRRQPVRRNYQRSEAVDLPEVDRLFASGRRFCFYVDATMATPNGFVPSLVFENNADHYPLIGRGLQSPYYWGHDLETATRIVEQSNADIGLGRRDASNIVLSSITASMRRDEAEVAGRQRYLAIKSGKDLSVAD